jgi:hypothetical protein
VQHAGLLKVLRVGRALDVLAVALEPVLAQHAVGIGDAAAEGRVPATGAEGAVRAVWPAPASPPPAGPTAPCRCCSGPAPRTAA